MGKNMSDIKITLTLYLNNVSPLILDYEMSKIV